MRIYIMHMFIESPYFSYYVAVQSGFWVSIRVLGIRGFGFGDGLSPESVSGAVLGFDFGFRVRVHRDFTRSKSAPLPSLHAMIPFLPELALLADSSSLSQIWYALMNLLKYG